MAVICVFAEQVVMALETVDEEPEMEAPVPLSQAKKTAEVEAPVAVSQRKKKESRVPANYKHHVIALYENFEVCI